ncbi:hypothetical protein ACLIBH_10215 [Virgibacillus sp. W0430]|uniref:hypothetical protein n=1 Tax=Virgibacillus sp. W0430 TaxID=3391580 RepID=UPI003F4567DD
MKKVMPGHLVNFGDAYELEQYEDYVYFGGAMVHAEEKFVYEFNLVTEVWCY